MNFDSKIFECLFTAIIWGKLIQRASSTLAGPFRLLGFAAVESTILYLLYSFCDTAIIPLISVIHVAVFLAIAEHGKKSFQIGQVVLTYIITKCVNLVGLVLAYVAVLLVNTGPKSLVANVISGCTQYLILLLFLKCTRRIDSTAFVDAFSTAIIIIGGVLFAASYTIVRWPELSENSRGNEFRWYAILVLLVFEILIIIVAINNSQRRKRERDLSLRVSELVQTAHRYKEIIPAVKREILEIHSKYIDSSELDIGKEISTALKEISALGEDANRIEQEEYSRWRNFSTTGLKLLDSQLVNEQEIAAAKRIGFRCVVCDPVNEILTERLSQFELQQLIGDLFRNAIRAVEDGGGDAKEILLILGYIDGSYEIKICDTGVSFPAAVLMDLGKRGVSTTGSGHGYADILNILRRCSASLRIVTQGDCNDFYSKKIEIIMDGKGRLEIETETYSRLTSILSLFDEEIIKLSR